MNAACPRPVPEQATLTRAPARFPAGACVYVVDGDFAVARGLESMLRAYDLSVRTFPSAEALLAAEGVGSAEAPEKCAIPACLITELGLPGMSGLDLLQWLRRGGSRVPVIIMANRTDVHAAVEAMRAGALDYLEKPFSQERLLERIGEALSRPPAGVVVAPALSVVKGPV